MTTAMSLPEMNLPRAMNAIRQTVERAVADLNEATFQVHDFLGLGLPVPAAQLGDSVPEMLDSLRQALAGTVEAFTALGRTVADFAGTVRFGIPATSQNASQNAQEAAQDALEPEEAQNVTGDADERHDEASGLLDHDVLPGHNRLAGHFPESVEAVVATGVPATATPEPSANGQKKRGRRKKN